MPTTRKAAIAAALFCAIFLGQLAAPASAEAAATSSEKGLVRMTNASRAAFGRAPLRYSGALSDKARAHSRKMADRRTIFHSKNLAYTLRMYPWTVAGENVGMSPTIAAMHAAFMASPGHRANVLYRSFRKVGVGIVWRNGTAYATVIFTN